MSDVPAISIEGVSFAFGREPVLSNATVSISTRHEGANSFTSKVSPWGVPATAFGRVTCCSCRVSMRTRKSLPEAIGPYRRTCKMAPRWT